MNDLRVLEIQTKYVADSEVEAKDYIEQIRQSAKTNHYMIKKASYEYKSKKAKGEVIAEAWVVTITAIYSELWEDLI